MDEARPKRQKLSAEELARKETERRLAQIERENEKLVKQLQKEQERKKRDEERLAEKKRKEEERLAEKRRKEEEKASERIRREEEKANERIRKEEEKAAEKKRRENEKLKDQSKINAFFNVSKRKQEKTPASDYDQTFLPFNLRRGGKLYNTVCNAEFGIHEPIMDAKEWLLSTKTRKNAEIVSKDKFKDKLLSARDSSEVRAVLASIQFQRLQFSYLRQHSEDHRLPINEEHRPPFVGFKFNVLPLDQRLALSRSPLLRLPEEQNYGYDSELEWVDEEDGEDVRFEESDDESGGEQYELNEFLSDDENSTKKPVFTGPLTPQLLWGEPFAEYTAVILAPQTDEPVPVLIPPVPTAQSEYKEHMDALCTKVGFAELKQSLLNANNSTATKTLHVELLKQQFPQATEKELRKAFDLCAVRVGKKKVEKKWVLTREAELYFA